LTIGAGPETGRKRLENNKWKAHFPFGNFGLPFKKSRFLRKLSVWETEISLPIYIPIEISGIFW